MKRLKPETGELFLPYVNKDGNYVLADKKKGTARNLSINKVLTSSREEALRLVRNGLHIRMKGIKTGQINIISPNSIVFEN